MRKDVRSIWRFTGALTLWTILVIVVGVTPHRGYSAEWTPPEIRLPSVFKHPSIACTAKEPQRLRAT